MEHRLKQVRLWMQPPSLTATSPHPAVHGFTLIKHGRMGPPKTRRFWMSRNVGSGTGCLTVGA